jgi:hypothetical protein
MNNLLNSAAAVGLGVYVIMTAVNGNLVGNGGDFTKGDALLPYVINDADYLEFVVALVAIWLLLKWGPSKEITEPLIVAGVLGLVLRAGASNTALIAALEQIGRPNFWPQLKAALGVQ